jgi:hypothetical protein
MRSELRAILVAAVVTVVACTGERPGRPTDAADSGGAGGAPHSASGAPAAAYVMGGGFPPGPCGLEPPAISSPAEGAVVSGREVALDVAVPEGPCVHAATTVIRVVDAWNLTVAERCAYPFDPIRPWNTTSLKDGGYHITAQRACSCRPCEETSLRHVTVRNGNGP